SATARNLGVSPLIIGLVIVGFGTSAPELVVSAVATVRGNAGLAVGNAIGSNIANMGLILGFTALIYPLKLESSTLKREYPLLLLIMLVSLFLAIDMQLTRLEGFVLLGCLFAMVAWLVRFGMQRPASDPFAQELEAEIPTDIPTRVAMFWLLISMITLPASSHFLVEGAVGIATTLNVSDTVIGLTIVAFGTSLPELATAITSAFRKEDDLAIGNIIGSNMFNLLGVLGIAAAIHPVEVQSMILTRDFPVMFLLTGLMFLLASDFRGPGRIGRTAGALLLAIFVGYQAMVWLGAGEGAPLAAATAAAVASAV
ncbi:MAG: calcium/sodium antiporter, partial [Xanthomonadales bacterium]|nr:calcium/sodium antiporter [Xanthomonadales bacterium]